MINPFREVNWNPGLAEKHKFAQSLVVGFPCMAAVLLCLKRAVTGVWPIESALWIAGVGIGLGLVLLLLPALTKPFYVAWYAIACMVGLVVSNILVTGLFFLVLTPIGRLLRVFGWSHFRTAPDRHATTYWQDAEQVSDPKRYYSQF